MTDKKLKNSIDNNIIDKDKGKDKEKDKDNNDDENDVDDNENDNNDIIKQKNNNTIKKEQDNNDVNDETEIGGKRKIKLRNGRKKFRSGFDYIRKKKKPIKKDDNNLPKERKRVSCHIN